MRDVIVIGAGVAGAAAAMELSKYNLKVTVIEKEDDVCEGTSKANSGIVHAGYDAVPGTLKAKLNVRGNEMMGELAENLQFDFKRSGSLVLCFDEALRPKLQELYDRGIANGVKDMSIIEKDEILKLEKNVNDKVVCALYAKTAGVVCPFGMNYAFAENAAVNGVNFIFNEAVQSIEKIDEGYQVVTPKDKYKAKCVVNAAGVYADEIHNMICDEDDKIKITARKGEYCLLDKEAGDTAGMTLFSLPTAYGKGILVTPTVHGNILLGPTAVDSDDKDSTNTTKAGLDEVLSQCKNVVPGVPLNMVITSFCGNRAHEEGNDFIIGEVKNNPGFIDCAGIESPGLTSAPAIGEMVAELVCSILKPEKKSGYIGKRAKILNPKELTREEKEELIKNKPEYANIICRCEMITEGEIREALRRPIPAKTMDGVKRRTRTGMGRCQGGFCTPKLMEIIAEERKLDLLNITKKGNGSELTLEKK